jgi:hypothetical protein
VIKNVNANPMNINARVAPVFLNNSGTAIIKRLENKRNKPKITIESNHDKISELLIIYWITGVNGSSRSTRSSALNFSLVTSKNCGFIFLILRIEKYKINNKIVTGRSILADRVRKTLVTPMGMKRERITQYRDKTPSGSRMCEKILVALSLICKTINNNIEKENTNKALLMPWVALAGINKYSLTTNHTNHKNKNPIKR